MPPPKGGTPKDEENKAKEKPAQNKNLSGQALSEKKLQSGFYVSGPQPPASTTPPSPPVSPPPKTDARRPPGHEATTNAEPSPKTASLTRNLELAVTASVTQSLTPTGRHLRARERLPAAASPPRPPKPEKNEAVKLKEAIKELEERLMHHKELTKARM